MSREVDWESELTPGRIEYAYGLANKMLQARNEGWAEVGLRAAKAQDKRLLRALERMAESTHKLEEHQFGQVKRSISAKFGETRGTTEHQLCREAWRLADQGQLGEDAQGNVVDARVHFKWIYGAAAWLCGYNL